ncbi:hypothetical protein OSTOST_20864 [Ostertagia ostertagi]
MGSHLLLVDLKMIKQQRQLSPLVRRKKMMAAQKRRTPLSFPTFGTKKDDDSSEKKSQLTFSTFGSKQEGDSSEKKPLSFPSFGSSKDDKKEDEKKPALSFSSFGSTTTNTAPSGGLQFSFGSLPKSSTEGQKGDDEGEYIPPKAEVVEFEEPGATFSSKCSVFKLVDKQYTKLGVGMLHLKEVEGKKSVLLLCPASEKEISTYVIRFPSTKEASKVLEEIEAAAK